MTKHTHTPGPMFVEYKAGFTMEGNTHIVMNADRYPLAFVPAWDDPRPDEENGKEEALANARLIASAPDLLEALKQLVGNADIASTIVRQHDEDGYIASALFDTIQQAEAAIRRAQGEVSE